MFTAAPVCQSSVDILIAQCYNLVCMVMDLTFEWNEAKAKRNLRKHEVSLEEAKTVFNDRFSITIPDPQPSIEEDRYVDIGCSSTGRVLVVVYTERKSTIRIISCRKATKSERRVYEEYDLLTSGRRD